MTTPRPRRAAAAIRRRGTLALMGFAATGGAAAHPHVFMDGGVDVVFGPGETLEMTWLHDAFETLRILSSHGLSLDARGAPDEADWQALLRAPSDWPDDFDGSAHPAVEGEAVALQWLAGRDAHPAAGRLRRSFTRRLDRPLDLSGRRMETGFSERTDAFTFSITDTPRPIGAEGRCAASLAPFEPDEATEETRTLLAASAAHVGQEETGGRDAGLARRGYGGGQPRGRYRYGRSQRVARQLSGGRRGGGEEPTRDRPGPGPEGDAGELPVAALADARSVRARIATVRARRATARGRWRASCSRPRSTARRAAPLFRPRRL